VTNISNRAQQVHNQPIKRARVHRGNPAHGVQLDEVRNLAPGLAGHGVVIEGLDDEAAGLEHATHETLIGTPTDNVEFFTLRC
jgi:hypothetical protein